MKKNKDFIKFISNKIILHNAVIELTNKCNLACRHCARLPNKLKKKEMSLPEIKKLLEDLVKLGCMHIAFTGGEPFMRDDFFEIIDYAYKLNFRITIFTNGTLLNKQKLKFLKKRKIEKLHISLYAADEKIHNNFVQSKNAFKKTISSIKNAKEIGLDVFVMTLAGKHNFDNLPEMKRLIKELNCEWALDYIFLYKDNKDKSPLNFNLTKEQILYIEKKIRPKPFEWKKSKSEKCSAGINQIALSYNGDVYPCILFRKVSGNIKKKSIVDIWKNSIILNNIRKSELREYECADCKYVYECAMRCPGIAYMEKDNYYKKPSLGCLMTEIKKEAKKNEKAQI